MELFAPQAFGILSSTSANSALYRDAQAIQTAAQACCSFVMAYIRQRLSSSIGLKSSLSAATECLKDQQPRPPCSDLECICFSLQSWIDLGINGDCSPIELTSEEEVLLGVNDVQRGCNCEENTQSTDRGS